MIFIWIFESYLQLVQNISLGPFLSLFWGSKHLFRHVWDAALKKKKRSSFNIVKSQVNHQFRGKISTLVYLKAYANILKSDSSWNCDSLVSENHSKYCFIYKRKKCEGVGNIFLKHSANYVATLLFDNTFHVVLAKLKS